VPQSTDIFRYASSCWPAPRQDGGGGFGTHRTAPVAPKLTIQLYFFEQCGAERFFASTGSRDGLLLKLRRSLVATSRRALSPMMDIHELGAASVTQENQSMPSFAWGGRLQRAATDYLLLSLIVAVVLWIWAKDVGFSLDVPAFYKQDGLSHGALVKTIIDTGWYYTTNPYLGAPFGANWSDYPTADTANYLLIKAIALFSHDWVVVLNAYYLAGFFLAAFAAYWVVRDLGLGRLWSGLVGLVFAFLPYHFLRPPHWLLANYFAVPLGVWLAVAAWNDTTEEAAAEQGRLGRIGALIAAIVLVGSSGVYYAFFAAFLVCLAALAACLARRRIAAARRAALILGGLVLVVAINISPSLIVRATEGANPDAVQRQPRESEIYGLKLFSLFAPSRVHRSEVLRNLGNKYWNFTPIVLGNAAAPLGIVGSIGLLIIFLRAAGRLSNAASTYRMSDKLSFLAVGMLVLATIGGLGAIFAYTVSPMIRAYDRASIYIGFLAVAVLGFSAQLLLDRMAHRHKIAPWLPPAIAIAIGVVAVWDQTMPFQERPNVNLSMQRRAVIEKLEAMLPAGTMVYQLPYSSFPEAAPLNHMDEYSHLRGYLHSTQLRWSYGGMRGRPGDIWLRTLSTRPIEDQVELAARSGFGAVYLDRRGYSDNGRREEKALQSLLGNPIIVSPDDAIAVYRMQPKGNAPLPLQALLPPITEPIDFSKELLAGNVFATSGISGAEPWGRWTDGEIARIEFVAALPRKFTIVLKIVYAYNLNQGLPIRVRIDGSEETFVFDGSKGPATFRIPFELKTPANTIEIIPPKPEVPPEVEGQPGARKLGVGLASLQIETD
jgi:phosphoglycerol transferase